MERTESLVQKISISGQQDTSHAWFSLMRGAQGITEI